jgi:hypothetical protein
MLSSSAVGAGLGGLGAIAALLVLLFLLKKKKRAIEEEIVTGTMETDTLTAQDTYVSEYGLSDEGNRSEASEDREDLPQVALQGGGGYESDQMEASEHNPEEFDDIQNDADEM